MDYWLARGFTLKGTTTQGTYIASRQNQHGVLSTNFFGELRHDGEWHWTMEEAEAEVRQSTDNSVMA